ncbi:MAG TPA: tRNA methyltransferase, partial [Sutterella wadsworthensis]|nr:tRNA methyltransferase [Sutterella wadsworthensis]
AIKTMGFRDLRVVAPREADYRTHEEALAYATSSADVLEASKSYATLAQALEGVTYAWAMTGYDREFGAPLTPMRQAASETASRLSALEGSIAFVFGTERSGLTNEEVCLCQGCAAIPADPVSPSLNLSQAVQIAAYEMQLALLDARGDAGALYDWQGRFAHEEPAPLEAIEGFFDHWERAMAACGAHDPKKPRHFMEVSRRLFGRAGLTKNELDLLRGVCAAVICPKRDRIGTKTRGKAAMREQTQNDPKNSPMPPEEQ